MFLENGRYYHDLRADSYLFPCDSKEQDRLDLFHALLSHARGNAWKILPDFPKDTGAGAIHPSDIPRILDVGCGTGIWAMDMAKAYKHAQVLGVDISRMYPDSTCVPGNCRFQAYRDYQNPWMLGDESFNFIHLQMACGSVIETGWESLYHEVYKHLRPGVGYFEQVEIDFEPRFENEQEIHDVSLQKWYQHLKEATALAGRPIAYNRGTEYALKKAGFVEIDHKMVGLPLNQWSHVSEEKEVGKWYNLAFTESAETLLLAPLYRIKRMPPAEIRELAENAINHSFHKPSKPYNLLHIFRARRP